MSAQNLAVVIGPSLFRVNSTPEGLETQTKANELAKKFILNYASYFTNVPKENIDSQLRQDFDKKSPKIHSPNQKRSKLEVSQIPTKEVSNHQSSASPVKQLTPPPTPPRSASPVRRAVEKVVDQFFDGDHAGNLSAHLNSPGRDSIRSDLSTTPVAAEKSPDLNDSSGSLGSHKRLSLPQRSAPLRGSRKKPSRYHRQTMSTSQDSLSSASNEKVQSPSGNFERLKDGESLTGWRHSPTSPKSLHNSRNSCNQNVKPENGEETVKQSVSNNSDERLDDQMQLQDPDTEISVPKLDLSVLTKKEQESPAKVSLEMQSSPAPSVGSPIQPMSVLSENESTHATAISTLQNTPGTSPEPENGSKKEKTTSPTIELPPQPEIVKLEKKLEKVSISDHRSQSRPKHRHSKSRKPPESPEVKSGQPENSKVKQRGRSRGPKPKKGKSRDPDGPTPIPISNPGSQVVSPRLDNAETDHLSRLHVAVTDLEARMREKREISHREEDMSRMSELQLREEKSELQRELLVLEAQFGRPQAGPERQAVRAIYHRYRELKRRLSELDTRPSVDQEAALREVEFELSRIERERREVASQIRAWERSFRVENARNPTNEEKLNNTDYIRYRHLKGRHKFLQEMLTQRAPGSFTV